MRCELNNPIPIFDALQELLGPLVFSEHDPSVVYPKIKAKLQELRQWGVEEQLTDLIDDSAKVMLRMKDGDACAAAAQVMSEIEAWKEENPVWLRPEER